MNLEDLVDFVLDVLLFELEFLHFLHQELEGFLPAEVLGVAAELLLAPVGCFLF